MKYCLFKTTIPAFHELLMSRACIMYSYVPVTGLCFLGDIVIL